MELSLSPLSKEELIARLQAVANLKAVVNDTRKSNDGAAGNILENLIGIGENNLPIANAAEWELKTQIDSTSSLVTLFHQEPSPTALRTVSNLLVPKFGWPHLQAGKKYPNDEKSFRTTLKTGRYTRGFTVEIDDLQRRVCVSFHPDQIREVDQQWWDKVKKETALVSLPFTPYWGFDDLYCKAQTKLHNCFFIQVESWKVKRTKYLHYYRAYMLKSLNLNNFIEAIRQGKIQIDIDARTGHNHGTKFRIMPQDLINLYTEATIVIDEPKIAPPSSKKTKKSLML